MASSFTFMTFWQEMANQAHIDESDLLARRFSYTDATGLHTPLTTDKDKTPKYTEYRSARDLQKTLSATQSITSSVTPRVSNNLELDQHPSNLGVELEFDGSVSIQRPYNPVGLYCAIVMCSIWGALIREGLSELSDHDMFPVFALLYPNLLGCMVMGPMVMNKALLISDYYEMYIGLGVGLCGSMTSFSSWQTEAVQAFINWPGGVYEEYTNGVDQVIGSLTIQIVGFAVALGGLGVGMMLTRIVSDKDYAFDVTKPPVGSITTRDWLIVAICLLTIILSLSITGQEDMHLFYVTLFAPLGALLRFRLSIEFNKNWFPKGTLMANMIGTFIVGLILILMNRFNYSKGLQDFLYGVSTGLAGCLTTVSTFALELRGLSSNPRRAFIYAFLSVASAQIMLTLICGTYIWNRRKDF